jgi:hypothetical protein
MTVLKNIRQILTARAMRRRLEIERASLDAWSLHCGREAAELWIEALAARDAARLSNA